MPVARTVLDTSLRYVGAAIYFIVLICLLVFLLGGLADWIGGRKKK